MPLERMGTALKQEDVVWENSGPPGRRGVEPSCVPNGYEPGVSVTLHGYGVGCWGGAAGDIKSNLNGLNKRGMLLIHVTGKNRSKLSFKYGWIQAFGLCDRDCFSPSFGSAFLRIGFILRQTLFNRWPSEIPGLLSTPAFKSSPQASIFVQIPSEVTRLALKVVLDYMITPRTAGQVSSPGTS